MLGIDIGHYSVKAVELQGDQITAFEREIYHLPRREKWEEKVVGVLSQVIDKMGGGKKAAWGSLSGTSVITHLASYPDMDKSELESAVRLEAEELFFGDLGAEMDFDWRVLGYTEESGYRILFVAAPREMCDRTIGHFKAAGLYPAGISVGSLAMSRAFFSAAPGETKNEPTVLINIGAVNTSVALIHEQKIAALRDVSFGGDKITESLMKELDMEFPQAEKLKTQPENTDSSLRRVVEMAIRPLMRQISLTIGHKYRKYLDKSGSVFLSGGGCRAPHLPELMEERFELPIRFIDPFAGLRNEGNGPDEDDRTRSDYVAALGCALIGSEEENEKHGK